MAYSTQKDARRIVHGKRWRRLQDSLPTHQFTAPDYLNELAEHAIQNNCIISIGSEPGKAYVTILLLREFGHQLRIPLECGGKRVVVVVPNGELAERRARMIGEHSQAYVYLLLRSNGAANRRSSTDATHPSSSTDADEALNQPRRGSACCAEELADLGTGDSLVNYGNLFHNAFVKYECIILEASLYLHLLRTSDKALIDKTCLLVVDDCHLGLLQPGTNPVNDGNASPGNDEGLFGDSVSVSYARLFKHLQQLSTASPDLLKHLRLIGMTAAFVQRYPQPVELERFIHELEHAMLDSPARTTSTMIAVNRYGNIPAVTVASYADHSLCMGNESFSGCGGCAAAAVPAVSACTTCLPSRKTAPISLHHRILALLGELKVSLDLCLQMNQAASKHFSRQPSLSWLMSAPATNKQVPLDGLVSELDDAVATSSSAKLRPSDASGVHAQQPDGAFDSIETGELGTIKIVQASIRGVYLNYKELGPLALHQTILLVISGLQDSLSKNLLHRDLRKLLLTVICRLRTLCVELEIAYELTRGATTEKLLKMCTAKVLKVVELLRQQFNERNRTNAMQYQQRHQQQQHAGQYGRNMPSNRGGRFNAGSRNSGYGNQQQHGRPATHNRNMYFPNCIVVVRRRYASWALHRIISLLAVAKSPGPLSAHALFRPGLLIGTSAAGGITAAATFPTSTVGGNSSNVDSMLLSSMVATDDDNKYAADLINTEKSVMSPKAVEEVLRYYRHGKYNVLVATSVVLDCGRTLQSTPSSAVISFDTVANYKAYMYCKGCVRAKDGQLILMTSQGQLELTRRALDIFKATDAVLMSRCGYSLGQPQTGPEEVDVTGAKEKSASRHVEAGDSISSPAVLTESGVTGISSVPVGNASADIDAVGGGAEVSGMLPTTFQLRTTTTKTFVTSDISSNLAVASGGSTSAASQLDILLPPYCPSRQQQHIMPPRIPLAQQYAGRPEYPPGGAPPAMLPPGNQFGPVPTYRQPPPNVVNFPIPPQQPLIMYGGAPHPLPQVRYAVGPGAPPRHYRQQRPFRNGSPQYRGGPPAAPMPYMLPPPPPLHVQQRMLQPQRYPMPMRGGRGSRMPAYSQRNARPVIPQQQYPVMIPYAAPPGYYGPYPLQLGGHCIRQPVFYQGPPRPPQFMFGDPYRPQQHRFMMMAGGDASGGTFYRMPGGIASFEQQQHTAVARPQYWPSPAPSPGLLPPQPAPLPPYYIGPYPSYGPHQHHYNSEMLSKPNITMHNAIAIINRYCANLPSDNYALLTPVWRAEQTARLTWNQVHNIITRLKHEFGINDLSYWRCVRAAAAVTITDAAEGDEAGDVVDVPSAASSTDEAPPTTTYCTLYRVELQLPINSPCRRYVVQGPWMPSILQAKQAAAQIMCIYLHRRDELDNARLLPVTKDAWKRDIVRELRRITIDTMLNRVVPTSTSPTIAASVYNPPELANPADAGPTATARDDDTPFIEPPTADDAHIEDAANIDLVDDEAEDVSSSVDDGEEEEDLIDIVDDEDDDDDDVVVDDDSDADIGVDELTRSPSPTKKSALKSRRSVDNADASTSKVVMPPVQPVVASAQQQVAKQQLGGAAPKNSGVPACAAYEPRMASTKRRRYYTKRTPVVFNQTFTFKPTSAPPTPAVDIPATPASSITTARCALYSIDMYLRHPLPPEQNVRGRKLFHPELATRSFGILLYAGSSPLPIINAFNIYDRSGEVSVRLRPVTTDLHITAAQLELLTKFHKQIFSGVLNMQRYSLQFDTSKSTCTYLTVPLRRTRNDPSNARIRSLARQVRYIDKLGERFAGDAQTQMMTEDGAVKADEEGVQQRDAVKAAPEQQQQHIGPHFSTHELSNSIGLDHVTKSRMQHNLAGNDESGYCGAMCSTDVCIDYKQSQQISGRKSVNITHVARTETRSSIAHPEKTIHNYIRPSPVIPYNRVREVKLDEVAELLSWAEIDWELIKKLDADMWQRQPRSETERASGQFEVHARPEEERRKMQFDRRDWEDAVVIPWYRNKDQMMAYYVEDVCDWMTPMSPFPDEQYKTFDEYYRIKYGLEIQHKNEPLIDVDHISTRMNLLLPRFLSRKGHALNESTSTKTSGGGSAPVVHHGGGRDNRNRQILIPELCAVHPLPASLWRKAICLPVILYRVQALLLMDELRVRLYNEAGIGVRYPRDGQWPPLCYGWSYAEKVLQLKSSATPPVAASGGGDGEKSAAVGGGVAAAPALGAAAAASATDEPLSEFLQQYLDVQLQKKLSQQKTASAVNDKPASTVAEADKVNSSTDAAPVKQSPTTTTEADVFSISEWSIDDVSAEVREKMQDDSLLLKRDAGSNGAEKSGSSDNMLMMLGGADAPRPPVINAASSFGAARPPQPAVLQQFRPPRFEASSTSSPILPARGAANHAVRGGRVSKPTASSSIFALPSGGNWENGGEEWPVSYDRESLFATDARGSSGSTAQKTSLSSSSSSPATATSVPVRITGSGWKDLPWSDLEYEIMEKVRQQKLRKKAARAAGLPYVAERDDELFGSGDASDGAHQQQKAETRADGEASGAPDDDDGDDLNLEYRIGFDSAQVGGVRKITKSSTAASSVPATSSAARISASRKQQRTSSNDNIPSVLDNVSYLAGGAAGGANATVIGAPPPPIVEEIDDDDDDDVLVAAEKMNNLKVSSKKGGTSSKSTTGRVLQHVMPLETESASEHATKSPPVASKLQFISGDDALTPDLLSSIRDDMSKYEAGEQLDELKGLYDDDEDEQEEDAVGGDENEAAKRISNETASKSSEPSMLGVKSAASATTAPTTKPTSTNNTSEQQQRQQYTYSVAVEPAVLLNIELATNGKTVNNFVLASVCQMRTTYTFISSLDSGSNDNNNTGAVRTQQNPIARVAMRLFEKQLADFNFDGLNGVRLQCWHADNSRDRRNRCELQLLVHLLRHSVTWCGAVNVQTTCCLMMSQLKRIYDEVERTCEGSDWSALSWCRKLLIKIYVAFVNSAAADESNTSNTITTETYAHTSATATSSAATSSTKAEFGEAMAYSATTTTTKPSVVDGGSSCEASGSSPHSSAEQQLPPHDVGAVNVDRIVVQPAEPPFSFDHYEPQTPAEERAAAAGSSTTSVVSAESSTKQESAASSRSSSSGCLSRMQSKESDEAAEVETNNSSTPEVASSAATTPSISAPNGLKWPTNTHADKKAGAIGRTLPTDYLDTRPPPPGPSPAMLLFGFTASNANDGINLERLETVGDSFLKYTITVYLYVRYRDYHEGKLSYARSLLVSNSHLYKLGERKALGQYIIANKFEPTDNWLPPCYIVDEKHNASHKSTATQQQHHDEFKQPGGGGSANSSPTKRPRRPNRGASNRGYSNNNSDAITGGPSPNLRTHHCVNDKTVADCVEALVGAVLVSGGTRDALALLNWLGLPTVSFCLPSGPPPSLSQTSLLSTRMLQDSPPSEKFAVESSSPSSSSSPSTVLSSSSPHSGSSSTALYSGIGHHSRQQQQLEVLYCCLDEFESRIGYKFVHKHYIIQAFTHATYHINRLTDCYQRLEFLGDAVLDYVITRHLFEDKRCFLPGELTDLRSALVNNAMFASLAVRYDYHKYLKLMSPQILRIVDCYVRKEKQRWHQHKQQQQSGTTTTNYDELLLNQSHSASAAARQEHGIIQHRTTTTAAVGVGDADNEDDPNDIVGDDDLFEAEETTVPKVLGDVFESVAGAIYLDSGMSLDAVWRVYFSMMHQDIEECCRNIPKSPVRALLEAEPDNVKFFKPERVANGKIRVEVQIFDKGRFFGLGRNYRAAKCTAARQALSYLREMGFIDEEEDAATAQRNSSDVRGINTLLADED